MDLDHQRVEVGCLFGLVAGMTEGSKRELWRSFEYQQGPSDRHGREYSWNC